MVNGKREREGERRRVNRFSPLWENNLGEEWMRVLFLPKIFFFPRVIRNFRATALPEALIGNFMASVYRVASPRGSVRSYFVASNSRKGGCITLLMEVKKKKKFFTVKFSSIVPFKERRGSRKEDYSISFVTIVSIKRTLRTVRIIGGEGERRKGSGIIFSILRSPPLLFLTSMIFGTK